VIEVTRALSVSVEKGREQAKMLVSRNTTSLDKEQVLSAAYESAAENLVDSIIAPLFYFGIGEVFGAGLAFAAGYRAINTMDAMLGYRDERIRLGWFPARMDDIFGYLPARIAGFMLLIYFALRGRAKVAYRSFLSDAKKRPGYNGGIPLALIAGGVGVIFEKPGVYRMGRSDHTLAADGGRVLQAVRGATLLFAFLLFFTLCLLRTITYM
jgi:adenosylcobinamide-phosphate synthase